MARLADTEKTIWALRGRVNELEEQLEAETRRANRAETDLAACRMGYGEAVELDERHARERDELQEQLEAALSFLSNINEDADETLLRMRIDRARECLSSPAISPDVSEPVVRKGSSPAGNPSASFGEAGGCKADGSQYPTGSETSDPAKERQ